MQLTDDEMEHFLLVLSQWRGRGRIEKFLGLYKMLLDILALFQRQGITRDVQFGATLAVAMIGESKSDLPVLKNGLTILEAMQKLSVGEPLPAWEGAPVELPRCSSRKRRHHYVWQFYLKAWASEEGAVWCRRRGEKRAFSTGTTMIGIRKDFYELRELTESDIELV